MSRPVALPPMPQDWLRLDTRVNMRAGPGPLQDPGTHSWLPTARTCPSVLCPFTEGSHSQWLVSSGAGQCPRWVSPGPEVAHFSWDPTCLLTSTPASQLTVCSQGPSPGACLAASPSAVSQWPGLLGWGRPEQGLWLAGFVFTDLNVKESGGPIYNSQDMDTT